MLDLHPDRRKDVDLRDISERLLLDRPFAVFVSGRDSDPTVRFRNDLEHLKRTTVSLFVRRILILWVIHVTEEVGEQRAIDLLLDLDARLLVEDRNLGQSAFRDLW